jgi:outer membrane receptor for ferrienterochelin and colicins
MKAPIICILLFISTPSIVAQNGSISGVILDNNGQPLPFANVILKEENIGKVASSLRGVEATEGSYIFENRTLGTHTLIVSAIGFIKSEQKIVLTKANNSLIVNVKLTPNDEQLSEVVVTGTMKEVRRSESPAPIEVYSAKFFLKNPTPNLFE